MADKTHDKNSKTTLIIGLFLIVVAFVCILAVFYFFGQEQTTHQQKLAQFEVQLANLVSEKSEAVIRKTDAKWTRRDPINIEDVLSRAESVYGPLELQRKEGVLWIDRKSSLCMITLGIVNGLKEGSILTVYEGYLKVGEVKVEIPHDIISYVRPIEKSLDAFSKNYYKVTIK